MINSISPILPEGNDKHPGKSVGASGQPGQSFKDMLGGFIKDVNELQADADESIKKLVSGEVKDIHQVMIKKSEADVSFKLMMQVRKKLMEAYKEVIKTPV